MNFKDIFRSKETKNKLSLEGHRKKSKKAESLIKKQTLTRISIGIKNWKNARSRAESEVNPDNTELIRVFRDIEVDAHLFALLQTIRIKVLANAFKILDKTGEIDLEATDKIKRKWFRSILKHTVDADFYGFSLVQLGDIVSGCYENATIVPRQYVIQQKGGVKKSLGNYKNLISFDEGVFSSWLIPIGERDNLGLLDKASPLVIKKKEVVSAWSESAELFGIPFRWVKTNIQDDEKKQNAEDMLDNMGEASWGVFGSDDEFGISEANKGDISRMYDSFIDRVNSELSKLILLQTGTTDEKTHVGSANVMENTLKDVIESYIVKIEELFNEVVIPQGIRHGVFKDGHVLKADNDQKLSIKDHFEIVKDLFSEFNISQEWISETFDVPIEDRKTSAKTVINPESDPVNVLDAVGKLYEDANKKCC